MTTIQMLPYQEPDKQVTAKHRAANLKEHLEAFLSINSLDAAEEVFEDECEVGAVINFLFRSKHITRGQFGAYLQQFTDLLPEFNRDQIGRLIARSLGYRTEDQMWEACAKGRRDGDHRILTARVRMKALRANSIQMGETGKGTVVRFRAAILTNQRVTPAEIEILNPLYHDFFTGNIVKKFLNWEEIKRELNHVRYDEPGRKRFGVGSDSHGQTLDAMIICLGYTSLFDAIQAQRLKGRIENLRYHEHVKIFGVK